MIFLANNKISPGMSVVMTIFAVIGIVVLTIFIFKAIKKERKRVREERANYIDGLMDKAEFMSEITAYISRSSAVEFSLMYIDIDKFSDFTSAFGADEAARSLERTAYNILDALPPRVALTRLRDDKFLAFAKGEYGKQEIQKIAKRILDSARKKIKIFGDTDVTLTVSIGISFYPIHGRKIKKLLESSEVALYLAKKAGGNQVKTYSLKNMRETENVRYYQQIKNAIKNKEFCLYYQPIIDTKAKKIFGMEGLMRWNHPDFGILPPYKFINIMEQSGDISWVGEWGLKEMIAKFMEIYRKSGDTDFTMSMNLSPKQLLDKNISDNFGKLIRNNKVVQKKIILEVGEFALFDSHKLVSENLQKLHDLGFLIAIDGLGLDYSTLQKLENMPIDIVKVSKDFISEEENLYLQEKYINLLIEFAQKEDKKIILEGIENYEMLEKTMKYGVVYVQGYYFSKPMPTNETAKYLLDEDWISQIESNVAPKEETNVTEESSNQTEETISEEKEKPDEPTVEEKAEETPDEPTVAEKVEQKASSEEKTEANSVEPTKKAGSSDKKKAKTKSKKTKK